MAAKRRNRAIAKSVARTQKKNPTYKYEGAMFVNDHDVRIPWHLKVEFEELQEQINRKHDEMQEFFDPLPHKIEGEETGATVKDLRVIGRELDFSIAKKTMNWQDFKNLDSFERYLGRMRNVARPEYIDERIRLYKRNFTSSLLETYGKQARDIAMKIRMMKPREYMRLVEQDESLEIGYYGNSDKYIPGMLNNIRRALGMREKEEWVDEELE